MSSVLVHFQYPDWLKDHSSKVSQEDLQRYTKQLELMNTICSEFEHQPEGEQTSQESSDKIMQLMQQVCVCVGVRVCLCMCVYLHVQTENDSLSLSLSLSPSPLPLPLPQLQQYGQPPEGLAGDNVSDLQVIVPVT